MPRSKKSLSDEEVSGFVRELNVAAAGKSSNEREMVRWVSRNLSRDWDQIDIDSVPDEGAVSLLVFAKANISAFYERIWPKTFTRSQLDAEGGRTDEGRDVLRTIHLVEEASKRSMAVSDE